MKTTKILVTVILVVLMVGAIIFAIPCYNGKAITYLRPCGGGKRNAE